jgi:hypothetical protein
MKLLVIKIVKQNSKRSNIPFFYYFFKDVETGKSYKTCTGPEFRNYKWWGNIKVGDVIEVNNEMVYKNLIDADTIPKILERR